MANKQLVLVGSPDAVAHYESLSSDWVVKYANGSIPPGVEGFKDVLAIWPEPEWCATICGMAWASPRDRVRFCCTSLADCHNWDETKTRLLAQGLQTVSAPQPTSADSGAPHAPEQAAVAETADKREKLDLDDFEAALALDHDLAAENALRSIRQATALKKEAFRPAESEGPQEWPEPADFWGVTELPEFLPQYLPAPIEPYVWKEKPILWGAVVGDPSSGKGPALDIALHKFYKIASALRQKDEAAWEQYDKDCKVHEKRMQKWYAEQASVKTDLQEPQAPTKPPRERLWTDDVTKEVVAKLLTENPRGKIAIVKDELASWFGGFDAYGTGKSDKDRPDWLSFYESKERYVDRAMEGRSYHVPSWGGIILGGIQPEVLARVQGKLGADGMLQRFQIIVARAKRQVPKRAADAEAVKDWNRILENLAALQPGAHPIMLSAEAAAYMDEQVQWIAESMQAGFAPSIVAALGKWEGLFGRLMITSHCIECAAQGLGHPSPQVSLRTAEQAWGWMRWILWPNAVRFYQGATDQGEEFKSGKAFAEYVLARDVRRIRPHRLTAQWSHYRDNYKTIMARREFWARSEHLGWVRPLGQLDRNSSLASEYEVNPLAFDGRFSEQSATAQASVTRYRKAMHPAMLAAQGRQPGED